MTYLITNMIMREKKKENERQTDKQNVISSLFPLTKVDLLLLSAIQQLLPFRKKAPANENGNSWHCVPATAEEVFIRFFEVRLQRAWLLYLHLRDRWFPTWGRGVLSGGHGAI